MMKPETLARYPVPEHLQDFLCTSDIGIPLFVC